MKNSFYCISKLLGHVTMGYRKTCSDDFTVWGKFRSPKRTHGVILELYKGRNIAVTHSQAVMMYQGQLQRCPRLSALMNHIFRSVAFQALMSSWNVCENIIFMLISQSCKLKVVLRAILKPSNLFHYRFDD